MLERVRSNTALITLAGRHVLQSGGKRLRAALALLAAQLGPRFTFDTAIYAATTVELIHVASLVHDDLVDEAERRRGEVSVHTRWDHGVALMVGDYFFALASAEMALAPDPRVITYFSEAVMTICEGELTPVVDATPLDVALRQYYTKIGSKTASLFRAACKAGIAISGGSDHDIEALGKFGYDVGLAFQIVDDILDFMGNEALLGKPAGSDLRHGIITLPLIYAVAKTSDTRLAGAVDSSDTAEVQWAIDEVRRLGIAPAYEEAHRLIEQSLTYLAPFSGSARAVLEDIAHFVLAREQ